MPTVVVRPTKIITAGVCFLKQRNIWWSWLLFTRITSLFDSWEVYFKETNYLCEIFITKFLVLYFFQLIPFVPCKIDSKFIYGAGNQYKAGVNYKQPRTIPYSDCVHYAFSNLQFNRFTYWCNIFTASSRRVEKWCSPSRLQPRQPISGKQPTKQKIL